MGFNKFWFGVVLALFVDTAFPDSPLFTFRIHNRSGGDIGIFRTYDNCVTGFPKDPVIVQRQSTDYGFNYDFDCNTGGLTLVIKRSGEKIAVLKFEGYKSKVTTNFSYKLFANPTSTIPIYVDEGCPENWEKYYGDLNRCNVKVGNIE